MVHKSHKLMDAIFNPLLKGEHMQNCFNLPIIPSDSFSGSMILEM